MRGCWGIPVETGFCRATKPAIRRITRTYPILLYLAVQGPDLVQQVSNASIVLVNRVATLRLNVETGFCRQAKSATREVLTRVMLYLVQHRVKNASIVIASHLKKYCSLNVTLMWTSFTHGTGTNMYATTVPLPSVSGRRTSAAEIGIRSLTWL